jgi:hypothetical protein
VLRRRACGRLEKLGLAVRESWEAREFLQRGAGGDYHKRVEEYCLMDDEGGTYISPASNGSSKLRRMGEDLP